MNCEEFRERVTIGLAEGSVDPGGHGDACAECGRYRELARAAWEAAGKDPDRPVPGPLAESILLSCRRPRRADLPYLRAGLVAAAAVLGMAAIVLFRPVQAGPGVRPMMDADGMSVERYELPAGASAAAAAEELRRSVAPETWREGAGGVEAGDGFLRVRATADVQKAVREFLQRRR